MTSYIFLLLFLFFVTVYSTNETTDTEQDNDDSVMSIIEQSFKTRNVAQPQMDMYSSQGIAESDEQVLLLGERVKGERVNEFCGGLAEDKLKSTDVKLRDIIQFVPSKRIPINVSNLTLFIPNRWFKHIKSSIPPVYVCYEGDAFLNLYKIPISNSLITKTEKFFEMKINNVLNERCRIRGLMIELDDEWHNRYLLPRKSHARVLMDIRNTVPRVTFNSSCDQTIGVNQPCCLWKFNSMIDNQNITFSRCIGSIPYSALTSNLIPINWADILVRGGMTRRFITPPAKVCREIGYKTMRIKRNDKEMMTINRWDATKCAAFY